MQAPNQGFTRAVLAAATLPREKAPFRRVVDLEKFESFVLTRSHFQIACDDSLASGSGLQRPQAFCGRALQESVFFPGWGSVISPMSALRFWAQVERDALLTHVPLFDDPHELDLSAFAENAEDQAL